MLNYFNLLNKISSTTSFTPFSASIDIAPRVIIVLTNSSFHLMISAISSSDLPNAPAPAYLGFFAIFREIGLTLH